MEIVVVRTDCTEHATPLLVAKIFEDADGLIGPVARIDEKMDGQISDLLDRGDFSGKEGQTATLYPRRGSTSFERVLLVGLGKQEEFDLEKLRRAAGTAVKEAAKLGVAKFASLIHHAELVSDRISPEAAGRAAAEGFVLGGYDFDQFKTHNGDQAPTRVTGIEILEKENDKAAAIERGAAVGSAIGRGQNVARTLGNLPGNTATPTYLAEQAREMADRFGMKVTILGPDEMKKEGMNALLAVAQGSDQEPRLIILEHRKGPKDAKPIMLVGKGLTFDAGGISIKPAAGMEDMKFDMCGGAAVLGAMHAVGEIDPAVNVVAIVPSSENLLSGAAVKPGDIIRSHNGKTIEIINTDAEGRLILADALSYAQRYEPAAIIDAATLTGSCVMALGHHASAAMTNDQALFDEVEAAGRRAGDRVWQMPMYSEYRDQIKSDYADIKNSGGRPAGTITAGWFLREFVGDRPWVHLDIAGTAYGDGKVSYLTKGATGAPTRLFVEWVLSRAD